jgi:DNA-binding response OmpR family regulator
MPQKILVVEDNAAFRKTVRRVLEGAGYEVLDAGAGKEGLSLAARERPELVILDLVLPGLGGQEVCQKLKVEPQTAAIPVLILTGSDREGLEVACLDAGADDYVTKPVKSELLLARCRALLRRGEPAPAKAVVKVGGLTLDYAAKLARSGGKDFSNLTPKEFDLLYELALQTPNPLDREALYRKIWGVAPPSEGSLKTVDVHARRIRQKLGWEADEWLSFVSGRGYRLSPPK